MTRVSLHVFALSCSEVPSNVAASLAVARVYHLWSERGHIATPPDVTLQSSFAGMVSSLRFHFKTLARANIVQVTKDDSLERLRR